MKNSVKKSLAFGAACAAGLSALTLSVPAQAAPLGQRSPRPTIVLVHGAFADGSSWRHVIPILQRDGYTVTAVQNPLTSLQADVAATRRLIAAQPGPVVVVSHSYGGMVATGAAVGQTNVKALVYVAAYAPDAGESIVSLNDRFPPAASATALVRDSEGYLSIDRDKFRNVFCRDVPSGEGNTLGAVQKPLHESAFVSTLDAAAWRTIPSWFLVSHDDMTIRPELERFEAKRMGARTFEIRSSHVALISHPQEVAFLIESAAKAQR